MSGPLVHFLALLAAFYIISSVIVIAQVISDGFALPLTPAEIYDTSKLNWFGAIILYLLAVIIFPAYYIITFIKFIFTVGRK